MALFAEFVGCERDVSSITPIEAREFRDAISQYPKSSGKRNALSGLGVRASIAASQRLGLPAISAVTASKYMSIVSPFFRWLHRDLYVGSNPFDGLHDKVVRGTNPRPPFTDATLTQFFNHHCSPALNERARSMSLEPSERMTGERGYPLPAYLPVRASVRWLSSPLGMSASTTGTGFSSSKRMPPLESEPKARRLAMWQCTHA